MFQSLFNWYIMNYQTKISSGRAYLDVLEGQETQYLESINGRQSRADPKRYWSWDGLKSFLNGKSILSMQEEGRSYAVEAVDQLLSSRRCKTCGKFNKCWRRKVPIYNCSIECQTVDWLEHKEICKQRMTTRFGVRWRC